MAEAVQCCLILHQMMRQTSLIGRRSPMTCSISSMPNTTLLTVGKVQVRLGTAAGLPLQL